MGFLGARQRKDGDDGAGERGAAPAAAEPRRLSEFEEREMRELRRRAPQTRQAPGDGRVDEERWQPIVVDRPAYAFEPKPPSPAPAYHVPDTVFEGWSSAAITMRLASVRGNSHRFRAQPRQDYAEVFFHDVRGSETVIFAVADGVSNAEHGELGSLCAVQGAVHALRRQLESGGTFEWGAVLAAAVTYMAAGAESVLGIAAPAPVELARLLATTLVVGAVSEVSGGFRVVMARAGDSGAWVLRGRDFRPVFAPKRGAHAELMPSSVEALPRIPARIPTADFGLGPDEVLLVGTDGFGDPLGDGTGAVGELFAHWLAQVPPPRGFAHLLDFSRDTFDDDRTLLAVWPRPRHHPRRAGAAG